MARFDEERSAALFDERLAEFESYVAVHGEGPKHGGDTKNLANWMTRQRVAHREGLLDVSRAERLDAAPGWTWLQYGEEPEAIATHLKAFFLRKGRVPEVGTSHSENQLRWYLEAAEKGQGRSVKPGCKKKSFMNARLRKAVDAEGLLFRHGTAETIERRREMRGRIIREMSEETGLERFVFVPHAESRPTAMMSGFTTGARVAPERIQLVLDDDDRKRVSALGSVNSVRVVMGRAGQHRSAFKDGKILEWREVVVERGERADVDPRRVGFLINRLQDAMANGEPVYSLKNLKDGIIDPDLPATNLSHVQPEAEVTARTILTSIGLARKAAARNTLSRGSLDRLDACPGWSWVEAEAAPGALAPAVLGLVDRHGAEVLTDVARRQGETGVARTLRNIDDIVARRNNIPGLDDDIRILSKARLMAPLVALARTKDASDTVTDRQSRQMDEVNR